MGKITKTEKYLLLLTAIFLLCLALLYFTADAAQLEALDGIGPTLAQRIVAYREEHGPFADIESIMDVNGIGEGIFETIRQQITVEDDT